MLYPPSRRESGNGLGHIRKPTILPLPFCKVPLQAREEETKRGENGLATTSVNGLENNVPGLRHWHAQETHGGGRSCIERMA